MLRTRCNIHNLTVGKELTGIVRQQRQIFRRFLCKKSNETQKMSAALQKQKHIIAVGQMCSTNDKAANLNKVAELVSKASEASATFLFLPECCDFVGRDRKDTLSLAETLQGQTMQRYRELARASCMWLSLGGIHELHDCSGDDGERKIYNTHVVINDNGDLMGIYRKLHLFDVDTPNFRFRESEVVLPGPHLVEPVVTPIGRVGLQICYDVRFPETSVLLRKMGADVLTYPSAFTYATGEAHWELLLRARAVENQCFVVAAAQVGKHNAKRTSWGHAMIVDPWGKVLADCGGQDQELLVAAAELDLSLIEKVRRNMPCFQHRRDDMYALTAFDVGTPVGISRERLFAHNIINPKTIFYETAYSYAFTNLCCVVEGHVLVSSKRVVPRLQDLNCAEISDLFVTAWRIQRMLEDIYQTTAATVTVQDGAMAGQTVPHVHFHVMPRRKGDFPQNDEIYVRLEERCEGKTHRTMDERIQEAEIYREYLRKRRDI